MNVYIVGRGAVGTFLGDVLARGGATVAYAPRDAASVACVAADLAIVAVKAYDTPGAIETLRAALAEAPAATILTPQNGVGNEERLGGAFGADRIVSGALTVPVERLADGASAAANAGGIGLAPVGASSHNWLVAAFERTALSVTVASDYRSLKWSKLALNILANASCAILDVLPERALRLPGIFDLELAALREARAVMAALGVAPIDLPRYPVRALFAAARLPNGIARALLAPRIAGARGRKPPSLLLDLRAGRVLTEASALCGAIAAEAAAHGLDAPVNATFARLVDEIALDPQRWGRYRENPAALVAAARE